jgi:hypothetical protein
MDPADYDVMHAEWESWQEVVKEFAALGMSINDQRFTPLVKVFCVWGEKLHALRATQTPEVVEHALRMYVRQLAEAREKGTRAPGGLIAGERYV